MREWRLSDADSLVRHANDASVARNLDDFFPHPYEMEHAREWLQRCAREHPQTNFAVVVDDRAIGGSGLRIRSNMHRRSAEIGYWLGAKYWGKGIATDVLTAVTAYAFDHFDLAHLTAGVLERNVASARVLEKAGYVLEGRLRQNVTKDGVTMDELVYGIVRP